MSQYTCTIFGLKITATALTTFRRCPFLYHVQYRVKEPLPVLGTWRRFGTVVHAAREAYEKHGRRLEVALEVLERRGAGLSPQDRQEARDMLCWRHERKEGRGGRPILIEGPLSTSVAGHRLVVRMDRLDEMGNGLLLAEYKAGRRVEMEMVRTQMTILAFTVWSVMGRAPAFWELELLRARKVMEIPAETDPEALEGFTAGLVRGVARGDREPKPYDPKICKGCPARAFCPKESANPKPFTRKPAKLEPLLLLF